MNRDVVLRRLPLVVILLLGTVVVASWLDIGTRDTGAANVSGLAPERDVDLPSVPSGPLILVAGTAGLGAGEGLFMTYVDGEWSTVAPVDLVPGRGYFAGEEWRDRLVLSPPPVELTLHDGWNLIGNSSNQVLALPQGSAAFVLRSDRTYDQTDRLQPGQGGWFRPDGPGKITLQAAGPPTP